MLSAVSSLSANPHVVGYERFYAEEPSFEGGAILYSELGCANCHGGSPVETPRMGPSLLNLNQRVERSGVKRFLRNPLSARSGSTMPEMMHGIKEDEVEAVVAYLGTLGKEIKFRSERHANAERGSALYHEKGCVACHAPTRDFRGPHASGEGWKSELAITHPDLHEKTSLEALILFLQDSSKYRIDGRMPHFTLERQEAVDIAAHLLDFQSSDPREAASVQKWPKPDAGVVERGKALVSRLRCASCHDLPGAMTQKEFQIKAGDRELGRGCLSSQPVNGLPHYDLDADQKKSLMKFLQESESVEKASPLLTLAAMNCFACHDRDGVGGPTNETNPFFVGDEGLGDSGRLPPPLTEIGYKLKADWMKSVFAGAEGSRVRPYLKTQMPNYVSQAEELTRWLQGVDKPNGAMPIEVRPDDVESGRKLLGIVGGVNCITCHHWGEQRSLGIPALDISSLDERLQSSWLREYLLDPASYRPGTLMPPLWPAGRSTVPDVLDGDTERQIAAIWGFIKDGQGVPEGFPDSSGRKFELVPVDRPMIQRTFLEKTGTKAILVGFPGEIHLAYDGNAGRPSLAWRGRFFDAYHTWYTRRAPFENPLGDGVASFSEDQKPRRFRGFVLDASGNPTFLSESDEGELRESFRVENESLIRTVKWSADLRPILAHPDGLDVEESSVGEKVVAFTYTWR